VFAALLVGFQLDGHPRRDLGLRLHQIVIALMSYRFNAELGSTISAATSACWSRCRSASPPAGA
jgi:hypothetical protein